PRYMTHSGCAHAAFNHVRLSVDRVRAGIEATGRKRYKRDTDGQTTWLCRARRSDGLFERTMHRLVLQFRLVTPLNRAQALRPKPDLPWRDTMATY
ncbi:MAG: hypothetical protein AAGL98_04730, partial [Planctomycetota bacterium]